MIRERSEVLLGKLDQHHPVPCTNVEDPRSLIGFREKLVADPPGEARSGAGEEEVKK